MNYFLKMMCRLSVVAMFANTSVQNAFALSVGAVVDFDRVTANNPDVAAWDRGVVTGTTTIAGKVNYKIRNNAGTPYTIPDDPRWIRVVDASSTAPAPDGTHTGPYPTSSGGAAGGALSSLGDGQTNQFGGAAGAIHGNAVPSGLGQRFGAGDRVQFDRAEGSKPEYGRWDEGVVVGRDQFGRVQIRGVNGTMYSIYDDPRWIIPAGAAPPGRQHEYLKQQTPVSSPTNPGQATSNAPASGGSAGPLAGEWAVVGVDGRTASGYGMTFNFVGSRYELIHYSGQCEAGHFSVSGSTIRMVQEDGSEYGTFQYSIQGSRLVLKASGTEFVCERAHK